MKAKIIFLTLLTSFMLSFSVALALPPEYPQSPALLDWVTLNGASIDIQDGKYRYTGNGFSQSNLSLPLDITKQIVIQYTVNAMGDWYSVGIGNGALGQAFGNYIENNTMNGIKPWFQGNTGGMPDKLSIACTKTFKGDTAVDVNTGLKPNVGSHTIVLKAVDGKFVYSIDGVTYDLYQAGREKDLTLADFAGNKAYLFVASGGTAEITIDNITGLMAGHETGFEDLNRDRTLATQPSGPIEVSFGAATPPVENPNAVELFGDTKFANGFSVRYIFGTKFSKNSAAKKGDMLEIATLPSPYQVYAIPDGVATIGNNMNKYWDFEEAPHERYVDEFGKGVEVLYEHRLAVNNKILTNTTDNLTFVQYNNYGLKPDSAEWDKKLVKQVSTNKNGVINLYYNTGNDIRNVAYSYDSKFGFDAWPHLLLVQYFREDIDMSRYQRIDFRVTYKVQQFNKLSDWPSDDTAIKGGEAPSESSLFTYFLLREKSDPQKIFWIGMCLYSSSPINDQPYLGVEQWGTGFYRTGAQFYGEKPKQNTSKTVSFDLKRYIGDAIDYAKAKAPASYLAGKNVDDYAITMFNIGTETIGDWEQQYELSNLSLCGQN